MIRTEPMPRTGLSIALAILAALLSLTLAPTARAEVRESSEHGFVLENVETVPVGRDAVWAALIDIARWWPSGHTWWGDASKLSINPVAGGCFCEIDGERQAEHMRVVFVEPGQILRLTGGLGPLQGIGINGILEFRIDDILGGGSTITLSYRFSGQMPQERDAFIEVVDRVQGGQLGGLGKLLREQGK